MKDCDKKEIVAAAIAYARQSGLEKKPEYCVAHVLFRERREYLTRPEEWAYGSDLYYACLKEVRRVLKCDQI